MAPAGGDGVSHREGVPTRSGRNVHSAYMLKGEKGDASLKGASWNATTLGKRQRASEKSECEDGAATPGPNTPATTNSGGTPAKVVDAAGGLEANKKQRAAWSAEAVALGYEAGTIKNSAYLLLAASGATGMTVAAIVDAATKQGLYSWGTCKTPNNSVTAALSQDPTFVRIAPSTYALRSTLKGGAGPMPQARTSSGSINSGAPPAGRSNSGSGLSGGAVAGGKSTLGQGVSSKARKGDKGDKHSKEKSSAVVPSSMAGRGAAGSGRLPPTIEDVAIDADQALAEDYGGGYGGGSGGHYMNMAQGLYGMQHALMGDVSRNRNMKMSSSSEIVHGLAMESYRRRMDLCGGALWDGDIDLQRPAYQFTAVRPPNHNPDESTAGSCLFWYPTANPPAPTQEKPSPLKEPTEALIRASSWKDEAKSLFSPNMKDSPSVSRMGSGHLPKWVLESFAEGKSSIAAA